MRFVFVFVLLAAACNVGECGLISWVSDLFSKSNSTSTPTPTTSPNATISLPPPCVPSPTMSPTLQALVNKLPPEFGALITPTNIKTLENVGTLAGLATSAATGNPVAIVKLCMFLASPDDPIPGVIDISKQMAPMIKSSEFVATFSNLTSSAAATLDKDFHLFKDKLASLVN